MGNTLNGDRQNLPFYSIDILAAIVGFSTYGLKQYIRRSDENRELYEQLVQTDKQKERFLISTSHELRTPLHGMLSIAETEYDKRRAACPEEESGDLELLVRIGRQMSQLLDDLMDLTLLRENRMVLHPVPLSVYTIAAGVADMLRYLTEGRNLTLHVSASEALPPVWADEKRLIQILFNLIHNAVKFTESGSIRISAEEADGQLLISVADTGEGIGEEVLSRIFQPYEQAGGQDRGGLGLGLSITLQLVELHGAGLRWSPGRGRLRLSLHSAAGRRGFLHRRQIRRERSRGMAGLYAERPVTLFPRQRRRPAPCRCSSVRSS